MQDHKKMTAMDYVIFVILSVGALVISYSILECHYDFFFYAKRIR